MRVVGIISEFNPFHKGHKYLIDQVRAELKPDCVIAVMSGNFVQRGEPAMWNKWIRAACAIENGVDIVFELPVCFAINSAEEFARGGVLLLKGLQIVTDLAFGSESGDVKALSSTASVLMQESSQFSAEIKKELQTGLSYPAAYASAFRKTTKSDTSDGGEIFRGSNDILAMEYMKQINSQHADFKPFAIKRAGLGHDEGEWESEFPSASVIRKRIRSENAFFSSATVLPAQTFKLLQSEPFLSSEDEKRYFALLQNTIRTKGKEELMQILSMTEGLENNFKKSFLTADSIDELIKGVKSKRHTYAKISRILVQSLLGLTKEKYEKIKSSKLIYARILGLNAVGAKTLRTLRKSAPPASIWTNINKNIPYDDPRKDMLLMDISASDIYSIIKGLSIYYDSDYVREPYISKN